MPRSFNIPAVNFSALREPRIMVRAVLGLLLALNLVAAAFAFHLFGTSTEQMMQDLQSARTQLNAATARLNRGRILAAKVDTGREEGGKFLASYMSSRKTTYSTVIGEITDLSKQAGMKMKEANIAPLDPIDGSADIDMMTISVNFEGTYPQLVKLVNLLDRSKKFLIIESLTAAPQPKGDVINVAIKLNTFVKDDPGGLS